MTWEREVTERMSWTRMPRRAVRSLRVRGCGM